MWAGDHNISAKVRCSSSIFIRDDDSPWTALDEVRVSKHYTEGEVDNGTCTLYEVRGKGVDGEGWRTKLRTVPVM